MNLYCKKRQDITALTIHLANDMLKKSLGQDTMTLRRDGPHDIIIRF
jgi:hypothetical protein